MDMSFWKMKETIHQIWEILLYKNKLSPSILSYFQLYNTRQQLKDENSKSENNLDSNKQSPSKNQSDQKKQAGIFSRLNKKN